MGRDETRISVDVHCHVSRHNSPQDRVDDALVEELRARIHAAVAPLVRDPRYASLKIFSELPGSETFPEDPGGDAQLIVSVPAGLILAGPLTLFGINARVGHGELLPFTYRDPFDPEAPDAPRPLRRARLVVIDGGEVPE